MMKEVLLKKGLFLKKCLCAQISLFFLCYAVCSNLSLPLKPLPASFTFWRLPAFTSLPCCSQIPALPIKRQGFQVLTVTRPILLRQYLPHPLCTHFLCSYTVPTQLAGTPRSNTNSAKVRAPPRSAAPDADPFSSPPLPLEIRIGEKLFSLIFKTVLFS